MPLSLEYFDGAGTADEAGVFLPIADLPGLESAELAAAAADKESKGLLAILNQIYETISPAEFDKLGFSMGKANLQANGLDIATQPYTANVVYWADFSDNTLKPLPIPVAGDNTDVGKIGLEAIFPNVAKIAAAGAVAGAGILIQGSGIEAYGGPAHADVSVLSTADNRDYLAALLHSFFGDVTLRTADNASAITARTRSNAQAVTPPPAWTAATNPTTGLTTADLGSSSFFSVSYGYSIQLELDQATQTFDVRHAVA